MTDFDAIVVGGGIAGLMSAQRLVLLGLRVALFERELLGSGSTVGNHGIVHSGAMYATEHPVLSRQCQEAVRAYRSSFPRAEIAVGPSWYFGTAERLDAFERCWCEHGIAHHAVDRSDVDELLLPAAGRSRRCFAVADCVVSSRSVLLGLTQRCLDAGVTIATATPVLGLAAGAGRVPAVRIGPRETLSAEHVVLCCGLGTAALVRGLGSSLHGRLRSRVAAMAVLPNRRLDRALFSLDLGGPTAVPTTAGLVLASRYGEGQPRVDPADRPGWSADGLPLIADVVRQVDRCVRPGVVETASAWGYTCTKTEVETMPGEAWGGGPNYAVVDHGARDGLDGLWSLIPGKMTVALHATRELMMRMRCTPAELALPRLEDDVSDRAERLVALQPWRAPRWPALERLHGATT